MQFKSKKLKRSSTFLTEMKFLLNICNDYVVEELISNKEAIIHMTAP